jgi:2-methylisocitrate lyase-like PEP mutase family enzyme
MGLTHSDGARSTATDHRRRIILRGLLQSKSLLVVPGAFDALSARVVEEQGFPLVYATGAGITNSYLGQPDLGLITLTEIANIAMHIFDAVSIPVIVDADTGFGNNLNVYRTVRELEHAGVSAIQLEDQVFPKRCGHFDGKQVVPVEEMISKIKTAALARDDPNLVLIARTDAIAPLGFEEAIARARAYAEAGADMTFVEAPQSLEQMKAIPRLLKDIPQIINLVEGGKTPLYPFAELEDMGYRLALCANTALRAAIRGITEVLECLRKTGTLDGTVDRIASWAERQSLVEIQKWEALQSG